MFRPESPRSCLGKRNFILGWITSVDNEVSIIDFLGGDCRKPPGRKRAKKSEQIRFIRGRPRVRQLCIVGYQLDPISHCSIPDRECRGLDYQRIGKQGERAA
jgi:hypothetical protein